MSLISVLNQVASWSYFEYMDYTLTNFITPKLARNATAGCHAILATVLAGGCLIADEKTFDGAYKILKLFSTGYFMYDIHYILRKDKLTITRWAWLYHHIVTIGYLHQNPKIYGAHKIIFWGELSNIPSYFVYYYLQKKMTNTQQFKIWGLIQKILYGGIRLPVLGKLTYDLLTTVKDKGPIYSVLPVYLMGLIWTTNLLSQRH